MTSFPHTPPSPAAPRHTSRLLFGIVMAWLALELLLIASPLLAHVPRPFIPLSIFSPVLLGLWAWRRFASLRAWGARVSLRVMALPHLARIAFGSAFLVHGSQGTLPEAFAFPAGTGDLLAGTLALCLIVSGSRAPRYWLLWSVLGLTDMVMVIGLAQYHIFGGHFDEMRLMLTFPYALAPLFVVPLVLMTHLLVLHRLWPRRANDLCSDPEGARAGGVMRSDS